MAKTATTQSSNPVVQQAQYLRRVAFVLDTETTGSNRTNDEVIDLGMVRARDGEVLINQRFKPSKKIEPFAYRVHGISERALDREPLFAARWSEYRSLLDGAVVVGWNVAYDRQMIETTCNKYGLEMPTVEWVDLMPLYRDFKRAAKNCKLSEACAELGVVAGTHSAKSDALAAARVLYKMAGTENEAKPGAPAVQVEITDPTITHQWEVSEVSEYYDNEDEQEEIITAEIEVRPGTAEAYLTEDGSVCIPHDARPALRHWLPGSQTLWQTLAELNAPAETVRRYTAVVEKLHSGLQQCKGRVVEMDSLTYCVKCGWREEAPAKSELQEILGF